MGVVLTENVPSNSIGLRRIHFCLDQWVHHKDPDHHPTQTRDGSFTVAFSAGIGSRCPGMEMEDCIIEDDKALYATKAAGRWRMISERHRRRFNGGATLGLGLTEHGRRIGAPKGVRTPVTDVRGRCPGPLDDGSVHFVASVEL